MHIQSNNIISQCSYKTMSIAKGKEIGENFINLKIIHKMISLQASLYPLNLSFQTIYKIHQIEDPFSKLNMNIPSDHHSFYSNHIIIYLNYRHIDQGAILGMGLTRLNLPRVTYGVTKQTTYVNSPLDKNLLPIINKNKAPNKQRGRKMV